MCYIICKATSNLIYCMHISPFVIPSRFANKKTGRRMLSTVVLFVTLMAVTECSKLSENHDVIREAEERAAKTEAKKDAEMKQIYEKEASRDEEMKLLK